MSEAIEEETGLPGESCIIVCTVERSAAGTRLDRFLAGSIETLSRARVQELIKKGYVENGTAPVLDLSLKVREGDSYIVHLPEVEPTHLMGEPIDLSIIYEDAHLIVIDKPAGLVVHPGAGNRSGTLANALIAHCGESLSGIGGVARPGIVHRLDKDTSGLMVAAKTDAAHRGLAEQFADHGRTGDLRREYLALVWGEPQPAAGQVETLIGRHSSSRLKMAVVSKGGKIAITGYVVEEVFGGRSGAEAGSKKKSSGLQEGALVSLVRCRLKTGRTHQVRVHMDHLGTPIIGDPLYGSGFRTKIHALPEPAGRAAALIKRQALHAAVLRFRHPMTRKLLNFESGIPDDIAKLCSELVN